MFCKKDVLINFAKFTGKYLCQILFFNKVAGLSLQFYWKRDSGTGVLLWILRNTRYTFSYRTPPVAASENKPYFLICLKTRNGVLTYYKRSLVKASDSLIYVSTYLILDIISKREKSKITMWCKYFILDANKKSYFGGEFWLLSWFYWYLWYKLISFIIYIYF